MLYSVISAALLLAPAHSLLLTPRVGIVSMSGAPQGGDIAGGVGSVGCSGNGEGKVFSTHASTSTSPSPDDFAFGYGPAQQATYIGYVGNGETKHKPGKAKSKPPPRSETPRDAFAHGSGTATSGSSVGYVGISPGQKIGQWR
jgi:hypothetical protein